MLRSALAFALVVASLLVIPARAADPAQTWLVLSDLHFDPFTQSRLVDRLAAAPPNRWREVFASGEALGPSGAGSDTNFTLLESTIDAARNTAADPRVVVIDGDFLAHYFRQKFDRTARVHDDAAYRAFVDKTMAFLAWEIQTAFPRAQLLPVIGESDGYCGDDASTPRDAFLARTAADWAASVGAQSAQGFIDQFSTGGYYTVPLPIEHAQAIVLNDVFWSARYTNACGNAQDDPGGDEVTWLQHVQASLPAGTPVWTIAHIPPGIDVASNPAAPFLAPRFNDAFLDALDAGATVMAIAAHTHMDSFRIIGPDPSTPRVPMLIVPPVSPVDGGAPAFTVLSVDGRSAVVDDSQVFVLTKIHDEWTWHREYDFDSIYGRGPIDALHLWNALQLVLNDDRVRKRFEQFYRPGDGAAPMTELTWHDYWCARVALTPTQFVACAMPLIQHDIGTHPSPPPTPTPTPTPTPIPSASPTP